jgi:hypothetical protein
MDEMRQVASEVKVLEGLALKRSEHALGLLSAPGPLDPGAVEARVTALLAGASV